MWQSFVAIGRDRGDFALNKKKERNKQRNIRARALRYHNGRP